MSARLDLERARIEHSTALVEYRKTWLELIIKVIAFGIAVVGLVTALVAAVAATLIALLG